MLKLRLRHAPWLAALAALTLALPAGASAAPGAIKAIDDPVQGFMDASQSDPLKTSVTINPGEKVTFSYPAGNSFHNVGFNATGPQPTSCAVLVGATIPGAIPPVPQYVQGPGWVGECTFTTPGTYAFVCTAHPGMIGSVVVAAPSNAPPTVTTSRTPSGNVVRNTSVAFTATGVDADGDALTYAWDFGDGQVSDVQNPGHIYDTPGTYWPRSPSPTAGAARSRAR